MVVRAIIRILSSVAVGRLMLMATRAAIERQKTSEECIFLKKNKSYCQISRLIVCNVQTSQKLVKKTFKSIVTLFSTVQKWMKLLQEWILDQSHWHKVDVGMFDVHVDKSVCVNEWVLTSGGLMCILRNSSRTLSFIAGWLTHCPCESPCAGLVWFALVVHRSFEAVVEDTPSTRVPKGLQVRTLPVKDTSSKVSMFLCIRGFSLVFSVMARMFIHNVYSLSSVFFTLTCFFSSSNIWFQFMFQVLFTKQKFPPKYLSL